VGNQGRNVNRRVHFSGGTEFSKAQQRAKKKGKKKTEGGAAKWVVEVRGGGLRQKEYANGHGHKEAKVWEKASPKVNSEVLRVKQKVERRCRVHFL